MALKGNSLHRECQPVLSESEPLTKTTEKCLDDCAIAAIDAEIHHHAEALISLKTRRNALAKISRLPPELLTMVFRVCAYTDPETTCPSRNRKEWLFVTQVTQVCRHWRLVALQCPDLWAHVSSCPRWTKEFLLRSGDVPLTANLLLGIDSPEEECEVLDLISGHSHRIRDMYLHLLECGHEMLTSFPWGPVPRLERLFLRYITGGGSIFPTSLSQISTPALRSVTLIGFGGFWNTTLFQNLSEILLHHIDQNNQPTLPELLSILRSCPTLKSLALQNAGPKSTLGTLPFLSAPLIHLPNLRQLDLETDALACRDVISHLVLPMEVEWSFLVQSYPAHNPIPVVPQSWTEATNCRFLRAWITSRHVIVNAEMTPSTASNQVIQTKLEMYCTERTGSVQALGFLIRISFWSRTTTLYLRIGLFYSGEDTKAPWDSLFGALPNLQTLDITDRNPSYAGTSFTLGWPSNAWVDALMTPVTLGTQIVYPCPSLSRVTLNMNFDSCRSDAMPKLLSGLRIRNKHLVRLNEVRFKKCIGLRLDDIRALEELVDEVIWDGFGVHCPTSEEENHQENHSNEEDGYELYSSGE